MSSEVADTVRLSSLVPLAISAYVLPPSFIKNTVVAAVGEALLTFISQYKRSPSASAVKVGNTNQDSPPNLCGAAFT